MKPPNKAQLPSHPKPLKERMGSRSDKTYGIEREIDQTYIQQRLKFSTRYRQSRFHGEFRVPRELSMHLLPSLMPRLVRCCSSRTCGSCCEHLPMHQKYNGILRIGATLNKTSSSETLQDKRLRNLDESL